jgi:FKBP-type peptidyl-prolyl cis-trans isomerase
MKRFFLFFGISAFMLTSCLEDSPTPGDQLVKEIRDIENYLAENLITNPIRDLSGIRIVLEEVGAGPLPPNKLNDIKVNYVGSLLSTGVEFDAGTVFGKMTDYIVGWQIALSLLPEGSKATVFIPSVYAYGTTGSGSIPPNATLVFYIHLESVTPTGAQVAKLEQDVEAIDAYIADQGIENVVEHESGVRYLVTHQGTAGITPSWYDRIMINYTGKILSSGQVFASGVGQPSSNFDGRIINYIHGLQIGLQLPHVQEGTKITLFIPSGLGYGGETVGSVPPNSNLIFEVELLDILEE